MAPTVCAATCASSAARSAGRCRYPLTRRNCLLASIIPAAHQRSAMVPFCQFFTLAEWVRAMDVPRQALWQGPLVAGGDLLKESDDHVQSAGVPGRGEGPCLLYTSPSPRD